MVDWGGDMYQHERFADFVREAAQMRLAASAPRRYAAPAGRSISALDAILDCWHRLQLRRTEQRQARTTVPLFQ